MKIAIVPVSQMTQQLQLWELEREVEEDGCKLEKCIEGVNRARKRLFDRQEQLLDARTRIDAARGSIDKLLNRNG